MASVNKNTAGEEDPIPEMELIAHAQAILHASGGALDFLFG
jgi:hypothetical protein